MINKNDQHNSKFVLQILYLQYYRMNPPEHSNNQSTPIPANPQLIRVSSQIKVDPQLYNSDNNNKTTKIENQNVLMEEPNDKEDSMISLSSNTRKHKMPEIILKFIMDQAREKKSNQPILTKGEELLIKYKIRKQKKMEKCAICEQEVLLKEMGSLSKCEHTYCTSCLHQYAVYKISAFQTVECPSENCHKVFDEDSKCFKQLPIKVVQKYKKLKQYTATLKDPSLKLCPDQNCEGFLKIPTPQNNDSIVVITNPECSVCGKKYCSQCMFLEHTGECDPFHLSFFQDTLHYRRCESCKNVIEKSQGCNHMTCVCGYQFCYLCGAKWRDSHVCNSVRDPGETECCDCACCECYINFCNDFEICAEECCESLCNNCCAPICECFSRVCECQPCGFQDMPICVNFLKGLFFIGWLLFVPMVYWVFLFIVLMKIIGGLLMGLVGFPCLLDHFNYEIQIHHIIIGIVLLPITILFFMFLGVRFMLCDDDARENLVELMCLPCQFLSSICQ